MHTYPEKTLQLAAVSWMTEHWGYQELAGDAEATGDRMDSIGLLGGAPIAVEVKTSVNKGMVRFDGRVANALEAKIAATIGGLFRGEATPQLELIRRHWDQSHAPEIAILAGAYSDDGFEELRQMLRNRGRDWSFNSGIWLWTGTAVESLFRYDQASASDDLAWSAIDVPILIGKPVPRIAPSLERFRQEAERCGLRSVLESFLDHAREKGLRRSRRPTGIGFAEVRNGSSTTVIALFLDRLDIEHGINVGVYAERFGCAEDDLPGKPSPRAGFMNTNRYVSDPTEVERLFDLLD